MSQTFLEAAAARRSRYGLSAQCPVSDEQLRKIIETAIRHAPSAFNSQSSRLVLLKGEEHKALWEMVRETLRKIVPADRFSATDEKISSFAAGYGTVLFFEDQDTVRGLQEKFPRYADNFPVWSEHHTGIVQYMVWMALEEAGLGANLQHYNPLIDDAVREKWALPHSWRLTAQMPFGVCVSPPDEKDFMPIEQRLRVFG